MISSFLLQLAVRLAAAIPNTTHPRLRPPRHSESHSVSRTEMDLLCPENNIQTRSRFQVSLRPLRLWVPVSPFSSNHEILLTQILATKYSSGFESTNFPADGLMGMGFQSISDYNAPPVFQTLVGAGQTTSSVFAFKLASSGSELTVGGLNSALYSGTPTYTPVTQEGYWQIQFSSLKVGSTSVVGSTSAIVDSVRSSLLHLAWLLLTFRTGHYSGHWFYCRCQGILC